MSMHILLVAPPWQNPLLPSMQVGVLKPYVEREVPGASVEVWSAFVEPAAVLPMPLMADFGRMMHAGELINLALLFPSRRRSILRQLERYADAFAQNGIGDIQSEVIVPLDRCLKAAVDALELDEVILAGFSVTFAQVFSTAYLARLLRARKPALRIVAGGSSCQGPIGRMLLQHFPEIDYVVHGEGEVPLTRLVRALSEGGAGEDIPSVYTRATAADLAQPAKTQVSELDGLPTPSFDEYFERIVSLPAYAPFRNDVRVTVEGSRGCWWDRSHVVSDALCQFCDNNAGWRGFRVKSPARIAAEVDDLTRRHDCRRVVFTDNVSRIRGLRECFESLARLRRPLSIFTEAYANVGFDDLVLFRRAGVTEIQFGIEALSTPILGLMRKGTSLMKNAFVMKACEELGIRNCSNLITYYPQVRAAAIRESIDNVARVSAYEPLYTVRFDVNLDSPIARNPGKFGIRNVALHPVFRATLPPGLQAGLLIPPNTFEAPQVERLAGLWDRLEDSVRQWTESRARAIASHGTTRLLTHREKGSALEILDLRFGEPRTLSLGGWKRELYRLLYFPRRLPDLVARFGDVPAAALRRELAGWHRRRLLLRDGESFMALSISESVPQETVLDDLGREAPLKWRVLDPSARGFIRLHATPTARQTSEATTWANDT